MGVDRRKSFEKQPSEEFDIEIDFTIANPLGSENILGAVASAVKWPRKEPNNKTDATSEILLSTQGIILTNICANKTRFRIIGGTHNFDYQITVLATFDDNSILEEELYLRVREN